jgi:hypothetical protein
MHRGDDEPLAPSQPTWKRALAICRKGRLEVRRSRSSFPIKDRKRASYWARRNVSQAIESSIVRQRQCSFLGKIAIFGCLEAAIHDGRRRPKGVPKPKSQHA